MNLPTVHYFQGGMYLFVLMDKYAAGWSLLVIAIMECIAIGWIYKFDTFATDIENMIAKRPGEVWKWLWRIITPVLLLVSMCTVYPDLWYSPEIT